MNHIHCLKRLYSQPAQALREDKEKLQKQHKKQLDLFTGFVASSVYEKDQLFISGHYQTDIGSSQSNKLNKADDIQSFTDSCRVVLLTDY